MKRFNQKLAALAAALLGALAIHAAYGADASKAKASDSAGTVWLTDMEKARKIAAKEGKSILIDFTGSDWCGWCIKLKKEVFSHDEFVKNARKDFVLVQIDFPKEDKLTKAQKNANADLGKKYGVTGFPTIVLTDADGKKFGQTGYREGGPKPYLKHLQKLLDRKDLE